MAGHRVEAGNGPPQDCEIAVVGGGIAGLCSALYLARGGRDVAVLERGEPWGDASGANAGTLSLQVKHPGAWQLMRRSIALWAELAGEIGEDIGFMQPGGLRVAVTDLDRDRLALSVEAQRRQGLSVTLLEGAGLREEAPWLGPTVLAAALCPEDALTVPLSAGHGLVRAVRAAGVTVATGCAVLAIERRGAEWRLKTASGALTCRALVIAAGPWSSGIAVMLGAALPLRVDVNMLSITESAPAFIDRIVTHSRGVLSLKQFANGTCIVGGGWQGRGDLAQGTKELDYENLLHNLRVAMAIAPGLEPLHIVRSWSGYEAVAPDALPLLGPLPGCPGVWVNAGARGGYSLAPALARLLADCLLTGQTPDAMTAFAPARLAA